MVPSVHIRRILRQPQECLTESKIHNKQDEQEDLHIPDDIAYHTDEVARGVENPKEVEQFGPHQQTGNTMQGVDEVVGCVLCVVLLINPHYQMNGYHCDDKHWWQNIGVVPSRQQIGVSLINELPTLIKQEVD